MSAYVSNGSTKLDMFASGQGQPRSCVVAVSHT